MQTYLTVSLIISTVCPYVIPSSAIRRTFLATLYFDGFDRNLFFAFDIGSEQLQPRSEYIALHVGSWNKDQSCE